MSNLYQCELHVEGSLENIIPFQYKVMDQNSILVFTKVVQHVEHWEVADVYSLEVSHDKGLMYAFELNRVPSWWFVEQSSIFFPKLTFTITFNSPFNGYCGKLSMRNGEVLVLDEETYDFQKDMVPADDYEENIEQALNKTFPLKDDLKYDYFSKGNIDISDDNLPF